MSLFLHLDDKEIVELLNENSTLLFDEFNQLNYHFSCNYESSDLNIPDHERQDISISLPVSEYYNYTDFTQLLTNNEANPVFMYNISSIPNNLENFLLCTGISSNDELIDVMAFCETRLSKDIEQLYFRKGYNLFSNIRNRYGGGVSMYIKKYISCYVVKRLCISNINI